MASLTVPFATWRTVNPAGKNGDAHPIIYPSSDGKRMADSTEQADWMVHISSNLISWYKSDPDVFVAVDLLWYPVEGNPKITLAPDVMVILGRATYPRKSYLQWEEANTPPQVVFEIMSGSNTPGEMVAKSLFFQKHGVEEFYLYDPEHGTLEVVLYTAGEVQYIPIEYEWTSPRLGVRFVPHPRAPMDIYYPDGEPFRTLREQQDLTRFETERADRERERAEREAERADTAQAERDAAQAERDAAHAMQERLQAKLRELGVDPDAL